jgi:Protein of unknown function (DUF3309)
VPVTDKVLCRSGVNLDRVIVAQSSGPNKGDGTFTLKNCCYLAPADVRRLHCEGKEDMSIGTILLIILVLILLGGVGGIGGSPFYGTGYYGGGGLGLIIVILLILVLMGRI